MSTRFILITAALVAACCAHADGRQAPMGHAVAAQGQGAIAGPASPSAQAVVTASANKWSARKRFATVTDRGEQLAFAGRDGRQDGAHTWHRTDLSEEHAFRAITDGRLQVTTPAGANLEFQYDSHVEHPSGDWTWIGHRPGHEGDQAILTFGAETAFGSIAQPDGPPLRLTARDGVNWLVETDPALGNPGDYGAYPDSFGYGTGATNGSSYTAMAQFQAGIDDHHVPGMARSDINGDGFDDLLYRKGGQFVYWLMHGKKRLDWRAYTIKPDTAFAGYGDFDGNGKADLVWIDASRAVFMWLGTDTGFAYKFTHTHGAEWLLAGIADIDGDGRDDMLWYSSQLQQLVVWYMNGFTRTSYRLFTVPGGYRFAGSGDFNGDGKGDLLWDNAARDLYMWIGSGTSFGSTFLRTYQSGWNLIGTRDINGDGQSDVQWRNQSSAEVTYWLMDGAILSSYSLFQMSRRFQSEGAGDFNGDGLADLVWRNDDLELYISFGDGSGFTNVYVATNGAGWSVLN